MALQHTDAVAQPSQFERALKALDHDFGKAMKLSDIMYTNPPNQCHMMDLHLDKEGFYVVLDVHHFTPEEITVVIKDNNIVVEGSHFEKEDDHGYVSRHFVRRYDLPKSVFVDGIVSTLSVDGVLTVSAPRTRCVGEERHIPILKTGIPALRSIAHHHHGK